MLKANCNKVIVNFRLSHRKLNLCAGKFIYCWNGNNLGKEVGVVARCNKVSGLFIIFRFCQLCKLFSNFNYSCRCFKAHAWWTIVPNASCQCYILCFDCFYACDTKNRLWQTKAYRTAAYKGKVIIPVYLTAQQCAQIVDERRPVGY